ncbi:hypothetical protein EBR03_04240 [bacterium]|nr:hypothetical protein [bacterium]
MILIDVILKFSCLLFVLLVAFVLICLGKRIQGEKKHFNFFRDAAKKKRDEKCRTWVRVSVTGVKKEGWSPPFLFFYFYFSTI